ncbi:MAG: cbb3-type cytochrome oxidase assembly protein CcoS [Bacteroidia bacterium]|nr:cbb3-type cytochrome oxidase assembly protein CcoS [Bacteroidia bacterium]
MKIILLLIMISLIIAGGFLAAFFWAVKDGQYDDDFTPSMRILIDDDMVLPEIKGSSSSPSESSNLNNSEEHGASRNV